MKYELILFDADDTLFDFHKAQEHAFYSTLTHQGITENSPNHLVRFREINLVLWKEFEQGLKSKSFLKEERFRRLARDFNFNLNSEVASEMFLQSLCEKTFLVDHAERVCTDLRRKARLAIVTNGIAEVQKKRLTRSGLEEYFQFMIVSEECGFQKPDPGIFEHAMKRAGHSIKETTLMVGDRLDTDIIGAAAFGLDTCWFNPLGLVGSEEVRPTYEIRRLSELLDIA